MQRSYLEGTWQKNRAFSPAVITEGAGRVIWVAGHGAPTEADGQSLAGDFESQTRQPFANLAATLERAAASWRETISSRSLSSATSPAPTQRL